MKTEITAKEYIDMYYACDWDHNKFERALKILKYDFGNIVILGDIVLKELDANFTHFVGVKEVRGLADFRNSDLVSIGNLTKVKESLGLSDTNLDDLGGLSEVGADLWLYNTPIVEKYDINEIRSMVYVDEDVFM